MTMQFLRRSTQTLPLVCLLLGACTFYDASLLQPYVDDGGQGDASMTGGTSTGGMSTGGMSTGGMSTGGMPGTDMDGSLLDATIDGSMDDAGTGMDATLPVDAFMPSGCGLPEFTDSDGDGLEDCEETCPQDPNKSAPGFCGCGYADEDDGVSAGCAGLRPWLAHRYRFSGSGTVATDSVGTRHGQIINTTLSGDGALHLAGGTSDQHVTLPAGILSALPNATIELWVDWKGGNAWQRFFDFGLGNAAAPDGNCAATIPTPVRLDRHFYFFCTTAQTWLSALSSCYNNATGASLVQINNATERSFLVSNAGASLPMWTGGNDRGTEGQWFWASGNTPQGPTQFWSGSATGSAFGGAYTAWNSGEPNNSNNEDCMELQSGGWNDGNCGSSHGFICESPPLATTPYSTLYVTPRRDPDFPRLGLTHRRSSFQDLDASTAFPVGQLSHVVLVYDNDGNRLTLYVNGQVVLSDTTTVALGDLEDLDNYIGRSHYSADDELAADIPEFRIYDRALSADLVNLSRRAGPDPSYLE